MNTVYIAFQDVDCEGSNVLSVNISKTNAEQAIQKDKDYRSMTKHIPCDGYHIEEHILRS